MKTIIFAFLVLWLLTQDAFCQSTKKMDIWFYPYFSSNTHIPDFYFYNTDIPELNKKILANADSLVGKKVGKGICREFVVEVIRNSSIEVPLTYLKKDKEKWLSISWIWETTDPFAYYTIYPGDILLFNSHIGIIYKIISPTEYIIINQNYSGRRKYTYVSLETINIEDGDWVAIYKPMPKYFHKF